MSDNYSGWSDDMECCNMSCEDTDDDWVPRRVSKALHPDEQNDEMKTRNVKKRGTGCEAEKTSQYRTYDYQTSAVYKRIQYHFDSCTIPVLNNLITGIRESCPDDIRPEPPSRSMKRIRPGLIYWLDTHESLALKYLDHLISQKSESHDLTGYSQL
jgi:hypothetical protein